MPDFIQILFSFILVSLGAILGSSLRWYILNKLEVVFNNTFFAIFSINNIAIFLLGILLGFFNRYQFNLYSNPFFLLFGVGLLGSLSTFSSFIMELLEFLSKKKFKKFFFLSTLSIISGIIVAFLGYELSNI